MNDKVLRLVTKKEKSWARVSGNMVLHRPTGVYYVRKFRAGKGRLFKSTGETRKGLAQTIADEMMGEFLGGKRLVGRRHSVGDLCDLIEQELKSDTDRRRRTHDKDATYLPIIKSHFGDMWADEIDEAVWNEWVLKTGKGLNRGLGDIAKYLSKVLTFAFDRKAILRKPKISNPDPRTAEIHVYSMEQVREFHENAEEDLKDLIVIGAECGLRPHENRELKWEWVTLGKAVVEVKFPSEFTKTKTARAIILSDGAAKIVWKRFSRRRGPYVFSAPKDPARPLSDVQLSRMWRRMLVRAEAKEGLKFHWLRHTFFSHALLDAKQPLHAVAAYGGNSPKVAFDRYMAKDAQRTAEVANSVRMGSKRKRVTGGNVVNGVKKRKGIKR